MVFYYRIASLYFANRMYNESIEYLNKIINQKNPDYREDIQCFARILCLIAHFELGNDQLVEYQIKSVYRFLLQVEDLHEVQKEIFRFLRRTPGMRRTALLDEFRRLHEKLIKLQEDAFERRPFMYLDIISWLETKLENRTIEAIVQDKFRRRQEKGR
jgi:tetratricopeptide (TPR) repeat protein